MNKSVAIILGAAIAALALLMFRLGRETAHVADPSTAVAADTPETAAISASPPSEAASPLVAPGTDGAAQIAIPASYALRPGMMVMAAASWEELLAGLEPAHRAIAEDFADRYPEAYQFATIEQLAWMVERGYPMPEEIIAAEALRMDELMQLAEAGNVKAMMLAVDRGARESEGVAPNPDDAENLAELASLWQLQHRMRESCSPFSAYAGARLGQVLSREDPGLGLLANLSFIQARGDWRVEATIAEMARTLSISSDALASMSMLHSHYADVLVDRCRSMPLPRPGG